VPLRNTPGLTAGRWQDEKRGRGRLTRNTGCARLLDRVRLDIGHVPDDRMPAYYRAASLVVPYRESGWR
jgi:hypothetical protein